MVLRFEPLELKTVFQFDFCSPFVAFDLCSNIIAIDSEAILSYFKHRK